MQPLVNNIHSLLMHSKKTIAVAESCTGGLLSKLLTDLPASSGYFILGIVAYSNKAKQDILNISAKVIAQKGSVSKEVAKNLANSVIRLAKTDLGVGITGIAGPAGGSIQKPVGTVFIAIASKDKQICEEFHFKGSRSVIRKKAALQALELLKQFVFSSRLGRAKTKASLEE